MAVHSRWPLTTGVAQGRYYCIRKKWDREKAFTLKGCSLMRGVHYERFHCTMEVGGRVQVSIGFFFFGKSFQNSPKPVLIF